MYKPKGMSLNVASPEPVQRFHPSRSSHDSLVSMKIVPVSGNGDGDGDGSGLGDGDGDGDGSGLGDGDGDGSGLGEGDGDGLGDGDGSGLGDGLGEGDGVGVIPARISCFKSSKLRPMLIPFSGFWLIDR